MLPNPAAWPARVGGPIEWSNAALWMSLPFIPLLLYHRRLLRQDVLNPGAFLNKKTASLRRAVAGWTFELLPPGMSRLFCFFFFGSGGGVGAAGAGVGAGAVGAGATAGGAGSTTFSPYCVNFSTASFLNSLFGKFATTDCHSRIALVFASSGSTSCNFS